MRLVLRKYSDALFKAGYSGAYHFPWVAPLAVLSRPLNNDELKLFAFSLGEAAGSGKINAGEGAWTAFPPDSGQVLFGPRLDLAIPPDAPGVQKAVGFFSPPVIGACLMPAAVDIVSPPPRLSFRAAAVANMFWQPLDAAGYRWKIGNLRWLPAVRKRA